MATIFSNTRRTTPLVDVHWNPSLDATARIVAVQSLDTDALTAGPSGIVTITASGVTKSIDLGDWGSGVGASDVVAFINTAFSPATVASVQTDGGGHSSLILEAPDSVSVDYIEVDAFEALGLQVVSVDLSVTDATSCTPHSGDQPTPGASSVPIPIPAFATTATIYPAASFASGGNDPSIAFAVLWDGMPVSGEIVAHGELDPFGAGRDRVLVTTPTLFVARSPAVPITLQVPAGITSISLAPVREMAIGHEGGEDVVLPPSRVPPTFSARVSFSD